MKSLIDVMATYGYNELELAFGNAGLRFLLDDMSISFTTENGTTSYSNDDIRTAVVEGNKNQNNSNNGNYWTEANMTEILGYASSKNIEIVPLLNMPGHMNALLDGEQFHQYRISGYGSDGNGGRVWKGASVTSIDPANPDAVAFGLAILQKYVDWFKEKVTYFNFGADEVGNDIVNPFYQYGSYGLSGFNDGYSSCAEYINECTAIIKNAGMIPRAFNDFLYYGENYNTGVDKDVQVCYWSDQWSGSPYITAQSMKNQGHQMINTNSEWYYVLGVENEQKEVDNNLAYALNSVDKYAYNQFYRRSGYSVIPSRIADTAGVMLCIWCDNPNAAKPETAIAEATQLFAKFAEKNSAVFPAKGEVPPTPQPEPTEPTTKDIYIAVGKTYTETIDGNHPGPYEGINTNVATVTGDVIPGTTAKPTLAMSEVYKFEENQSATGVISDGNGNYLKVSGESLTNTTKIEEATKFTVVKTSTNKATIQVTDTNSYLKLMNTSGSTSSIMAVEESYEWEVGLGSDFCWYAGLNNYYYLAYYGENWTSNNNWAYAGHLYAVEPGTTSTADKTKLTFTGVKTGNTEVTIGTTKYLIHVSEAQLSDNRICINYYITNHKVEDENGNTSRWVSAGEGNINSDKGVAIEDLIALTGTDTFTKKPAKFYKATAQSGNNIQTDAGWTNKIAAGDNCAKLRYWNNTWSVCDASGEWHDVVGKTAEYNPDTQREASAYGKNDGYAAITVYYGQQTDVTDEITTYATDWGEDITTSQSNKEISLLGDTYALLDFAVKYQTGDRTPTSFTNAKTIVYNGVGSDDYHYSQDGNTRIVKDLFVENTEGYEVYMITVTKCSEKLTTDARNLYALPAVTYAEENEKVVWVDKEADLGDFAPTDKHYPGYKEGGEPIVPAVYVAKSNAYLVTYYVRAVSTDQLQVNYIDQATGKSFYHYGINVHGTTTFSENIALNRDTADSWKGDLVNGTVTNDKNKNQTVSADLSTMPEIGAEYRHVAYTCNHIQLSADRKTLNLYYTFNNTVTFVADFGLPITINKGDLSKTLTNAGVEITEVKAAGVNHGAVEINEDVVTYTPDKRFVADENGESFTLTYTGTNVQETGGKAGTVAYRVNILPASNVLYEENFLTEAPASSSLGWTPGTSVAPTTPQQTQKAKAGGNVFGYDAAYVPSDTNPVTGELGVWKIENLKPGQSYPCLSTTFYGNGFDLIGNCSPTTGRVLLLITDLSGKGVKAAIVDTRYNSAGENGIYQVPLAHLELEEGTYIAEVRASGLTGSSATRSAVMQASSLNADIDEFASVLAKCGLTMADVEFIEMSSGTAKPANRVPSYYAASVAEAATFAPGTHVEIDGFRVYRSTTDAVAMNYYPANEQRMNYQNIIKVMANKVITAYSDNGVIQNCEISEYQKQGGPKKEIYLKQGQSISFDVQGHNNLQVSLRAVTGSAQTNVVDKLIATNTEMYYTIRRTEGLFTISNIGEGILAIGNVKLPDGAVVQTVDDLDEAAVFASVRAAFNAQPDAPDQGAFAPEIFNVGGKTTRMFRNKIVTLRVKVSADVDYVTIDNDVYRTNKWTARLFGYSTITVTKTVRSGDSHEYSVVAYNAQGQASAAKTWGY